MIQRQDKLLRLCCRLTWAGLLLLWAVVTITAFAFHHHHPEDSDCGQHACPFLLVVFNIPLLSDPAAVPLLPKPVTPAFYTVVSISLPNPMRSITVRGPPVLRAV